MASPQLIQSDPHNFQVGRSGHKIIRCYFHRTAVSGDTAVGEANYFKSHALQASAHYFIDTTGITVQSVPDGSTAYAVAQLDENHISISIEFSGLNNTPLTRAQILAASALIKSDPALRAIHEHRLTIAEIPGKIVSGFGTHKDVTTAYQIHGGHTDFITGAEINVILAGAYI